jgi:hypothetical protein
VLLSRRHDDAALACFDRSLAIDPTFFDAHVQRATMLREQGRIADAVMSWRRAMTLAPAELSVWSNLVHTLLYSDDVSAEDLLVWHRRFDKVVGFTSAMLRRRPSSSLGAPSPRRQSDCALAFSHPTCAGTRWVTFTEQLFEHHDRSQMEIVCYHDSVVDDDVGARLAAHAARWVKTARWTDDELVAQIAGDELDVLIDLAGHTGFAPAPARSQAGARTGDLAGLPRHDRLVGDRLPRHRRMRGPAGTRGVEFRAASEVAAQLLLLPAA